MPNRYRLSGSSLAELGARAIRQYGPSARIVASEKVAAAGLAGFLGRRHYEATVEVSQTDDAGSASTVPEPIGEPEAVDVAADVEDTVAITHSEAQEQTDQQERPSAPPSQRLAERGVPEAGDPEFAQMIDQLWRALRDPGADVLAAARSRAPAPLGAPGALVVVTGLAADAGTAAQRLELDAAVAFDLASLEGQTLRDAKRDLLRARAEAVAQQVPVLAVAPLEFPRPGTRSGADHPVIRDADQLWAAVDVGRKVEDTRRWLSVVAENRAVDGVVLIGTEQTLTPETGRQLGLPVYN